MNLELRLLGEEFLVLWKNLCEQHNLLFELTCDEYSLLLSHDIDNLELKIEEKKLPIKNVTKLDAQRLDLINQLSEKLGLQNKPIKFYNLVETIRTNIDENIAKNIEGYNGLLLDMIEKIQAQNKTNQLFLNKALVSVQELKSSITGQKFDTYNSKGVTKNNVNRY